MLFLPPQELETPAPVPKGGFFALRVGLGGLLGALMLAALALCNPYEIIQGQHVWGARMLILGQRAPAGRAGADAADTRPALFNAHRRGFHPLRCGTGA